MVGRGDLLAGKRIRVGPGGRITIPAEFREELAIQVGDYLTLIMDDGEIRLVTVQRAVRRAQEIVRRYVPEGVSLSDELIVERRREADRD